MNAVVETTRCAHCAQDVHPALIEPGAEHQFCCAGCRAVYETIHACGLDSYYRLRDAAADADTPNAVKPIDLGDDPFDAFDTAAFEALYVTLAPDHSSASTDLVLEGVTCAACVWLVERLPHVLPGVIEARLSLREAAVRVTWDPTRVKLSRIARTLNRFGYKPHAAKGAARKQILRRDERRRLLHLGAAGALMGNTMLLGLALYAGESGAIEPHYRAFFRWASGLLGVIALAWPGGVFFQSAYAALRTRTLNLDVPITLALLVGGVAGVINLLLGRGEIYFDSLTVLVFLLLVGRWMQYRQQRRADDAVELLFSLTPSTCHLVQPDQTVVDAPVDAVRPGDTLEVRGGELIPADGVVVAGRSAVDQALLTGESLPVEVAPGDVVHAGAQNVGGLLRLRAQRTGRETRVGQLMRLVERGVAEKPAIVQFTDRVGAYFVAAVSLAAAATFALWCRRAGITPAIDHTVALLIVTCPCVLGLATPLTVAMAIGRLARADVLVKSGAALERLARGGQILLDKTGTLTQGRLQVIEWIGDPTIQPIVAAVERCSNHPIARALAADAETTASDVTDLLEEPGAGIRATVDGVAIRIGSAPYVARAATIAGPWRTHQSRLESTGATVVFIARNGVCVACAALADQVRRDAPAAVATLSDLGWTPSILSGDTPPVVQTIARQVGIPAARARGSVSPEQKLAAVRASSTSCHGGTTIMVGDGVNDAAALAAADVGIAVHGGAEASLAAADVYVARPGLAPLVLLVQTSRHVMRVIRRNLAVSLAYNLLAGALAATGHMTPLIAAILMPVSSATVLALAAASITAPRRQQVAVPATDRGATWK